MNEYPFVVLLVLNYNGKPLLRTFLHSLRKTDYQNYKILVVDNGSTDGSKEMVKKEFPECDLLYLEKNRGYSGGNNAGIRYILKKYSNVDYLLLLNNDMEVIQKEWLTILVFEAKKHNAWVSGCKLLYPNGTIQHGGVSLWPPKHIGRFLPGVEMSNVKFVDAITGACFLIKVSAILKLGVIDEVYTPFLSEDIDYCCRVNNASRSAVLYVGNARLLHYESVTTKAKKITPQTYYIILRNGLILRLRYAPIWEIFLFCLRRFFRIFFVRDQRTNKISWSASSCVDKLKLIPIYFRAIFDALRMYKIRKDKL